MIVRLLINFVRFSFKRRCQILKCVIWSIVFLALSHRYSYKYKVYTDKDSSKLYQKACLNLTYKELENEPVVNYFNEHPDLNWQLGNDVHKYAIQTGKRRKGKAFLTVGIPSIKRVVNSTYLIKTLHDLEAKSSAQDKAKIICVVFLCDVDRNYNLLMEKELILTFPKSLEDGFFRIVRVESDFYPHLDDLKRNFNDPPERVRWRAKQVSDFIFLFRYCSSLGQYHLQLEDDVLTVHGFADSIERYIKAVDFKEKLRDFRQILQELYLTMPSNVSVSFAKDLLQKRDDRRRGAKLKARWTILDFSELGFIGKLFRSEDLEKFAAFLAFYYDEQPVDWLIVYFLKNMGQGQKYFHIPALFQHFGLKSSFNFLQENKLKDRMFDADLHENVKVHYETSKIQEAINPLAAIFSNISEDLWQFYIPGHSFHFKIKGIQTNNTILFLFPDEQNISSITLETGNNKNYCSKDVSLVVGHRYEIRSVENNDVRCSDTRKIGTFGRCSGTLSANDTKISCIVLKWLKGTSDDVVLTNLLIFPLK